MLEDGPGEAVARVPALRGERGGPTGPSQREHCLSVSSRARPLTESAIVHGGR